MYMFVNCRSSPSKRTVQRSRTAVHGTVHPAQWGLRDVPGSRRSECRPKGPRSPKASHPKGAPKS
eukprot:4479658-Amphidinium_carterae.2